MVTLTIKSESGIVMLLGHPQEVGGGISSSTTRRVELRCDSYSEAPLRWLSGPIAERLVGAMELYSLTDLSIDLLALADDAVAQCIARYVETSQTLQCLYLTNRGTEASDVLIRAAVSNTTRTFKIHLWSCAIWKSTLSWMLRAGSNIQELAAGKCELIRDHDTSIADAVVLADPSRGLELVKIDQHSENELEFMQLVLQDAMCSLFLRELQIFLHRGGSNLCNMGDALGRLLASCRTLERLYLETDDCTKPTDPPIMVGLAQNRSIRYLTLFMNLEGESQDYLASHLQCNRKLAELDLSYCRFGPKGLSHVLSLPAPVRSSLSNLCVRFGLQVEAGAVLREVSSALPRLPSLEKLEIDATPKGEIFRPQYFQPPNRNTQGEFLRAVQAHPSLVEVKAFLSFDYHAKIETVCERNQAFLDQLQNANIGSSAPLALWARIISRAALSQHGRALLFRKLRGNDLGGPSILELLLFDDNETSDRKRSSPL